MESREHRPGETEPLLKWERPLTAAERQADRDLDAFGPIDLAAAFRPALRVDPLARAENLPTHWSPQLPASVPLCRVCLLPNAKRLCGACKKLLGRHGESIETLDLLTVCEKRESPERLIWAWKDEVATGYSPDEQWLVGMAAALSAYLEAHRVRLLPPEGLVTAVPSRAPLMETLLYLGRGRGWFATGCEATGEKVGSWFQHTSKSQEERLSRQPSDWAVDRTKVRGRRVLLLDDVFVTGASLFSYARALAAAGAIEVRALALVRHVHITHWNYFDALRIVRRTQQWKWSPQRAARGRTR